MAKMKLTLKRELNEDDKLAPQAKIIVSHMKVGNAVDRDHLVEQVDKDPKFESRQGAGRVLHFYLPKLVELGLVEKEAVVEPKAEGEDKPKAKKSGKSKKSGEAKAEADDEAAAGAEEDLADA